MRTIDLVLTSLDERHIARAVGLAHDEARLRFPLQSNTVRSFEEFCALLAEYYNHHFACCIGNGGRLSMADARSHAKELIEREYRRHNGDLVSAFNDACHGTNGGMRAVLDVVANGLREQGVARYVRDVFDRYVAPHSWDQKVLIIEEFIERCGDQLSSSIRRDQPARYAQNYRELIEAYVRGLRDTSSLFRRL